MKISFIKPRPELARFIESFWVFESASGFPATDVSIAAPNGCAKLIIPYKNSLESGRPTSCVSSPGAALSCSGFDAVALRVGVRAGESCHLGAREIQRTQRGKGVFGEVDERLVRARRSGGLECGAGKNRGRAPAVTANAARNARALSPRRNG